MLPGDVKLFRWSFLLITCASCTVSALELNSSCTDPLGKVGICVPIEECKSLLNVHNNPMASPEDFRFLNQSRCGVYSPDTIHNVCCSSSSPKYSLPESPNCGTQRVNYFLPGQTTRPHEFPWSALIAYQSKDGNLSFHCGASLINQRYAVTAAHCVTLLPDGWKVLHVRLGEWDLTSSTDCAGNYCTETPIDVVVEKIIVHQAYVSRDRNHHNDIALIRLAQKVAYSWTIHPICLPLSSAVPSRTHGHTIMHAAGWGIGTTDSTIPRKLKMEFKVLDLNECTSEYRGYGVTLNSTQLCATPYRLQDTCSRDSGGPLMQLINGTWYLLGVASINPGNCGPSRMWEIYTNVKEYVDWIGNNIH